VTGNGWENLNSFVGGNGNRKGEIWIASLSYIGRSSLSSGR